jgi:hypothetical protein
MREKPNQSLRKAIEKAPGRRRVLVPSFVPPPRDLPYLGDEHTWTRWVRPIGGYRWRRDLQVVKGHELFADWNGTDRPPWLVPREGGWEEGFRPRQMLLLDRWLALADELLAHGPGPHYRELIVEFANQFGGIRETVILVPKAGLGIVEGESITSWVLATRCVFDVARLYLAISGHALVWVGEGLSCRAPFDKRRFRRRGEGAGWSLPSGIVACAGRCVVGCAERQETNRPCRRGVA